MNRTNIVTMRRIANTSDHRLAKEEIDKPTEQLLEDEEIQQEELTEAEIINSGKVC